MGFRRVAGSFCLVFLALLPLPVSAEDSVEREGRENCVRLAAKIFDSQKAAARSSDELGVPGKVTNVQSFLTWRATCVEDPPKAPGKVTALCEADAVTAKGEQKRVFYWEKADGKKTFSGYSWCY